MLLILLKPLPPCWSWWRIVWWTMFAGRQGRAPDAGAREGPRRRPDHR